MAEKKNKRAYNTTILELSFGAIFVAIFALVSNIPFLSNIQILPGVPFSLQPLILAVVPLILGLKVSFMTYMTILFLTIIGLPMMSGGKGGLAVFVGPTGGYVIGWVFLILFLGVYKICIKDKLILKEKKLGNGKAALKYDFLVALPLSLLALLLMYILGTLIFIISTKQPINTFFVVYLSNLGLFLPFDIIKIIFAIIISNGILKHPIMKNLVRSSR